MSEEEVKNDNNDSKKKWLLLLLLLFLIIFIIWGIVVFLKDDGTAQALDDEIVSNEIVQSEESKDKSEDDKKVDDKKDSSDTTKPVATIKTATQEVVVAAAGTSSSAGSANTSTVQKEIVKVNIEDDSYFSEPVVIEIAGNEYTATITDSKGNVVTYNGKTTITEEGTYTLTIKETDGNETSVVFVVDTTAPVIEGVEEKLYNTEVSPKVTEVNLDVVSLTKDGTQVEYTLGNAITEDGEYVLKITDKAGNEASVEFSIDRTAPTYTVNYSAENATNKDVVVTITASENIYGYTGWEKSENDATITKTYAENAEETVTFTDEAGNQVTVNVKVENIDKTVPTYTVAYSTEDPTNKDVVVTITASENIYGHTGWEKSGNDATITKTYAENTEDSVTFTDEAGNEVTVNVKVANIDKVAPALTVKKNITSMTKKSVTVRVTADEQIQLPDNTWSYDDDTKLVIKKVYRQNIEEDVIVKDLVGNEATAHVKITNIDKTAPTLNVKANITSMTKKSVTIRITANEQIQLPDNTWSYDDDTKLVIKKVYRQNIEEDVVVKDLVGNEAIAHVKITNIDKTAPTLSVKANITSMTKKSVTIRIRADEQIQLPDNTWSYDDDTKLVIKKVYRQNIEEDVVVKDLVGNEATAHVKITNIDKVAPVGSVTSSNDNGNKVTNQDVTATLVVNEPIKALDGWTKVDEYTYTKVYSSNQKVTLEIEDLVGNKSKVKFEIKRIDKVAPVVTIVSPNKYQLEVHSTYVEKGYSAYDAVDKDVSKRVTKKYQFQAKGTNNWLSVNELDTSKLGVYKVTYIFTDKAGNEGTGTRVIQIVDTTAPLLTLNGDAKITLEYGRDTYVELGATVTDNYDATITNLQPKYINYSVNNVYKETKYTMDDLKVGTYKVVYEHSDSSDNIGLDANRSDHTYVMRIVEVVDTTAPVGSVTSSNENGGRPTNQDVTATLVVNEPIKALDGWTKVDEYTYTKVYSSNQKVTLEIEDLYGNKSKVKFEIKRIDKVAPVVTIVSPNKYQLEVHSTYVEKGYSAYDAVDKDVSKRVTKKYQFQAKGTNNWASVNELDTSKLGVYKVTYIFTDKAGNEGTGTRVVEIVDTTAPLLTLNGDAKITLEYGRDTYVELGATVTDNYDATITNLQPKYINYSVNSVFKETKYTMDNLEVGTYKVVYEHSDSSDNIGIDANRSDHTYVMRTVEVVDTTAPTATVKYSTEDLTNKDVVVTLELSEEAMVSNAGTWNPASGYQTTFKKSYNRNMTQVVTLTDKYGNVGTAEVKIENIDKEPAKLNTTGENNFEPTSEGFRIVFYQTVKANEDIEFVNTDLFTPINGSTKEYELKFYSTDPVISSGWKDIIVRDKAGNETTVSLFIPVFEQQSTLSSAPMRMVKSARPVTSAAPTATTVQSTEPVVATTETTTAETTEVVEPKAEETPVVTDTPVVEEPKVEETPVVTDTPVVEEPKAEETPVVTDTPVVEEPKVEETPVVTDTPVVEEPKVEETPTPTTPVVETPVTEVPVVTE